MSQSLLEISTYRNTNVLANASELVARVIMEVAGNDISSSLNGNGLCLKIAYTLAQSKFKTQLESNHRGGM